MIFVTVGTQLPFDRLVRAVDEWAAAHARTDVFAQIGPGDYAPRHLAFDRFITPQQCDMHMRSAKLIIAHAGMGSIIGALELGTPIVIVPRRASLGEHRNDHQLATARRFQGRPGIAVAEHESDLPAAIDSLTSLSARDRIAPFASPQLLAYLRSFIHAGTPSRQHSAAARSPRTAP